MSSAGVVRARENLQIGKKRKRLRVSYSPPPASTTVTTLLHPHAPFVPHAPCVSSAEASIPVATLAEHTSGVSPEWTLSKPRRQPASGRRLRQPASRRRAARLVSRGGLASFCLFVSQACLSSTTRTSRCASHSAGPLPLASLLIRWRFGSLAPLPALAPPTSPAPALAPPAPPAPALGTAAAALVLAPPAPLGK
jgi:hypothetical protein